MSFLSRLFGSGTPGKKKGAEDVEARLRRLELEAEHATAGYVGTAYNRAGDVALRDGRPERAVDYYGRAINSFLEDGQREAARGVANKIIRVRPSAVRTLCTLTWLDLAARHQAMALMHLRDYVEAAKGAGQHARAATQIYEMAKISGVPEFVGAVADALDGLDFGQRAEQVRRWASDGPPNVITDPHELSSACLRAAIESNDAEGDLLTDHIPGAESSRGAADRPGDDEAPPDRPDEGRSDAHDGVAPGDHSAPTGESSNRSREEKRQEKNRYRWE